MSLSSSLVLSPEWHECDGSGYLAYPRYFEWFERGARHLFEQAGLPWAKLFGFDNVRGLPCVAVNLELRAPARFGARLMLDTGIIEWRPRAVRLAHALRHDAGTLVEATETRIWWIRDDEEPEALRAGVIPDDIRLLFQA